MSNFNHEEVITTLESTSPDVLFSQEFQKQNPYLQKGFADFFAKNYQQVEKVTEITYSTNHVTYYFYKNNQNNDVRILKSESGCFSSNQKFVSLDSIIKHKKELEEERDMFVPKLPKDKRQDSIEWCNNKINSVDKVLTTYAELTNNKTPKIKM